MTFVKKIRAKLGARQKKRGKNIFPSLESDNMSNLYDAMLVTERVEGMKLWGFETVKVRKVEGKGFRVLQLVEGSILWVKPLHSGMFEVDYREEVSPTEKQDLKAPLHPCLKGRQTHSYTDHFEADKYGRLFSYCACGDRQVSYLPGANVTEHKKASTVRDVIRNPELERRTVFGAMVWNDWSRDARVLMYLSLREDGLYQGYIDQKGDVLQKFVVMRDPVSGDYIINHPYTNKEGKVKRLRPIQRTDYFD